MASSAVKRTINIPLAPDGSSAPSSFSAQKHAFNKQSKANLPHIAALSIQGVNNAPTNVMPIARSTMYKNLHHNSSNSSIVSNK